MNTSRRAKLYLDPYTIEALLNLPDGVHVRAVQAHIDPMRIEIVVTGDHLPEVPLNAESMIVVPYLTRTATTTVTWPALVPDPDDAGDVASAQAALAEGGPVTSSEDLRTELGLPARSDG